MGDLGVQGVIFSPSASLDDLPPPWPTQEGKDCLTAPILLPLPFCHMPSHALLASPGHHLIPASTLQMFRGDTFPDSPLVRLPHPFVSRAGRVGPRRGVLCSFHTPKSPFPRPLPPRLTNSPWMCQKTPGASVSSPLSDTQSPRSPLVATSVHYTVPSTQGSWRKSLAQDAESRTISPCSHLPRLW